MALWNTTSPTVSSTTTEMFVDELPHWVHLVAFSLYATLLVAAVIVDTVILFVFYRVKELRNVTNNLLCNMIAADLLLALQTPLEGLSVKEDRWFAGDSFCKFHRFLLHTFYNVVIISLTIVSIERYYAICQPLRFKKCADIGSVCNWKVIIATWIAACFLALPQIFISSTEWLHGKQVCMEERPDNYLVVFLSYHIPLFIFLYFIPVVIMTFTYGKVSKKLYDLVDRFRQRSRFDICGAVKMRRSIIRMLLVVVVVFVVCLTPLTFIELLHVTPVMNNYDPFGILNVCVDGLVLCHSLLNPLVSSFMSKEFRKAARQAFRCTQSLDLCKFSRKEKDNKCKLEAMKQNVEANGAVSGKTFRLDEQNNEPSAHLRKDGVTNKAYVVEFAADFKPEESFVTETTEIPKEEE